MRYAYIQAGRVVEVIEPQIDDAGREVPIEERYTEEFRADLVECSAKVVAGMAYEDGKFSKYVPPPPSPAEVFATNAAMRDNLLGMATLAIAPLQDAVDLDEATAAEIAMLKKWKQFRVSVNRVDLSAPSPTWPSEPA